MRRQPFRNGSSDRLEILRVSSEYYGASACLIWCGVWTLDSWWDTKFRRNRTSRFETADDARNPVQAIAVLAQSTGRSRLHIRARFHENPNIPTNRSSAVAVGTGTRKENCVHNRRLWVLRQGFAASSAFSKRFNGFLSNMAGHWKTVVRRCMPNFVPIDFDLSRAACCRPSFQQVAGSQTPSCVVRITFANGNSYPYAIMQAVAAWHSLELLQISIQSDEPF